jgi:hypothetical protein
MILTRQWRSLKNILLRALEQKELALNWENEDIEMIHNMEIPGKAKEEN